MARYLVLMVVISLYYASSKATSSCEQKIAEFSLDAAADMIAKAKSNLPTRNDCGKNITREAKDCSEILQMGFNKSGVYTIRPASRVTEDKSLDVYCDMQTTGGGWTVVQRRGNFQREADYFNKNWKGYKDGFGDIEKDFWLGNDNIFALTNQNLYSVRFDLGDIENRSKYAQYDTFWIDDEDHQYTLHVAGYTGDAGDSLIGHHNNQKFTTKDRDNDNNGHHNCADLNEGAWWFNNCHYSNLNGLFLAGKNVDANKGIHWHSWKGYTESLQSTEIKIRPKKFRLLQFSSSTPM